LKVAVLGNPVLRVPAEPVKNIRSPEIQRLIDDMVETMREYNGVGLAAPQVHQPLQLIVVEGDRAQGAPTRGTGEPIILLNPQITPLDDRQAEDWEGCLSIPGLRGRVPRHAEIDVQAVDRRGRPLRFTAAEFFARVVQHENDHLAGIVFLDRMKGLETLTFLEEYARYWSQPEEEEEE
jgi:peptide deformylase